MDSRQDLYLLEKFEVGVIHLDAQRNVVALNDFARRILPVDEKKPFNKLVTAFHPSRSQPKVKFLLDEAASCPMGSASPMTMIINIPEQVLLIKVSRMSDVNNALTGFVLVFYDVTSVVSHNDTVAKDTAFKEAFKVDSSHEHLKRNVQLSRIPVVVDKKVTFVETAAVLCLESQAHYTRLLTSDGWQFCNLSIGDLEARLSEAYFMRVHRRFIVNVSAVQELSRVGGKTQLVMSDEGRTIIPVSRDAVVQLRNKLGV